MTTLNAQGAPGKKPRPLAAPSHKQSLVNLPPHPPFLFCHHPSKWLVMDGKIVPQLDKWAIQIGVNRVDATGNHFDGMEAKKRRGWQFIPRDVDGPGTDYVVAYRVQAKGKNDAEDEPSQHAHLDRWERCFVGSKQIRPNVQPYAEWCAGLVDAGVVEKPQPYVLEILIDKQENLIAEYRNRLHTQPGLKPDVDNLESTLAVLRAALEESLSEPAPAVPAKRSSRSKGASNGD